jgi:hypothetical protein
VVREEQRADSPYARLFSLLFLRRRQSGVIEIKGLSTRGRTRSGSSTRTSPP